MVALFADWLRGIGLERHVPAFERNDIDFDVVSDLDDAELQSLGLSLGDRKRLSRAIAARAAAEGETGSDVAAGGRRTVTTIRNAERRQVSVLFADLSGYTRLSSRLDPEDLQVLVDRFLAVVDAAIGEHGGTVDKHLGDGVMAVFGAPVAHGDDTARAVRAAVAIHDRLKTLSAEVGQPLRAHIGIASGEVLAGAGQGEYTVIGETVNLASRLGDLAPENETYVSSQVQAEVQHLVEASRVENLAVKGLDAPVTAWRILGTRVDSWNGARLPLVGRQAECMQFRSVLDSSKETGTGATFILRGEPGIGKTRLADEFVALALRAGCDCHRALVLDFGGGAERDPLRAIFRSLLGLADDADQDQKRMSAHGAAARLGGDIVEPFILDLLGLPMSEAALGVYEAMENAARNSRKTDVVCRLLKARCADRLQLVVIEDMHWADAMTKSLASRLARAVFGSPGLVILTTRIEGDPFDAGWYAAAGSGPVHAFDLRPLSAGEAREFARAAGALPADGLIEGLARAGGNPLYLEQIIQHSADAASGPIPGTLRNLVQARIDRLDASDRLAVQAASLIGQRFSLAAVRHLIDDPDYEPATLMQRSLVRPHGDDYLFAHALVQEGVYASLPHSRARELHLKAGRWFRERDATLSADHLARAGSEDAAEAYRRAAHQQHDQFHFERARALCERGLALATRPADLYRLNMLQGRVERLLRHMDAATGLFRNALSYATSPDEECAAWIGVANSCYDRPAATAVLDEALTKAETLARSTGNRKQLVRAHFLRGTMHSLTGDSEACLRSETEAVRTAEELGQPALIAYAMQGLAMALYQVGRFRSVLDVTERLRRIADENGLLKDAIEVSYKIGVAQFYLMQLRDSAAWYERVLEQAPKLGLWRSAVVAGEYLARNALERGDLAQAASAAEASRDLADQLGQHARRSLSLIQLSGVAAAKGDADALPLAEQAVEAARGHASGYVLPWALAAQARATPSITQRLHLLDEAETLLQTTSCSSHNHFHVRTIEIEEAFQRRDWDGIEAAAERLAKFVEVEPLPWTDFHIRRGRLLAAWGRGDGGDRMQAELDALSRIKSQTGTAAWLPAL